MPENGTEILLSPKTSLLNEALQVLRQDLRQMDAARLATAVDGLIGLSAKLRDVKDLAFYLQGGILSRLHEGNVWARDRRHGGMSWARYCETVLAINAKTARYLMRAYARANTLGLSPKVLDEIGWSRTRRLLTIATPESLEGWLERARKAESSRDFERQVKAAKAGKAEADVETQIIFRVTADQRELILSCIEEARLVVSKAGGKGEDHSDGVALQYIFVEWLGNHARQPAHALDWVLRQIGKVFGVHLGVTDARDVTS